MSCFSIFFPTDIGNGSQGNSGVWGSLSAGRCLATWFQDVPGEGRSEVRDSMPWPQAGFQGGREGFRFRFARSQGFDL